VDQFPILWDYTNTKPALRYATPRLGAAGALAFFDQAGAGFTRTWDYSPAPNTPPATVLQMFAGDWYDRIHYEWIDLNVGYMLGEQVRSLWVWNAYRRARILNSLVTAGVDGIIISTPGTPPLQWAALQIQYYSLTITFDGPPVISATLTFNWDESYTQILTVIGFRSTPWPFVPNWNQPVLERLEWKTDVLQAHRLEEQRRSVRIRPRRMIEFDMVAEDRARRLMQSLVWGWGGRVYAVPLWWDCAYTTSAAAIGSTTIAVDPGNREFEVGQPAILIADYKTVETVEVLSVGADHVEITRPLTQHWPETSRFMPARTARIDPTSISAFTGDVGRMRARFVFIDGVNHAAALPAATHNGYPVLEIRPNWIEDPSADYERVWTILDNATGVVAQEDLAGIPTFRQRYRWTHASRDEIEAWRQALFALRGRQGAIYVPTWSRDFIPATTILSGSVAIDVEHSGYSTFVDVDPGRRDIRIELVDGTILYRSITASSELTTDTERITIDSSLGVTVDPDQVAAISFMALMRLDADAAEFSWWTSDPGVVNTSAVFRGFRHSV
jgi:hypothetical protein